VNLLEYGALGILGAIVFGAMAICRSMLVPYLRDALSTNAELRDLCRALREALVGQGQRLARVENVVDDIHSMVVDLHQVKFGTGRSQLLRGKE